MNCNKICKNKSKIYEELRKNRFILAIYINLKKYYDEYT
jgi:hypothetical protein